MAGLGTTRRSLLESGGTLGPTPSSQPLAAYQVHVSFVRCTVGCMPCPVPSISPTVNPGRGRPSRGHSATPLWRHTPLPPDHPSLFGTPPVHPSSLWGTRFLLPLDQLCEDPLFSPSWHLVECFVPRQRQHTQDVLRGGQAVFLMPPSTRRMAREVCRGGRGLKVGPR